MAAILSAEETKVAKAWLHDILVWCGIAQPKRAITISKYRYMYGQDPVNDKREKYRQYAVIIGQAITKRAVGVKEFQSYDEALEKLSYCAFSPDVKTNNRFEWVKKTPAELASYIAWFCKENKWWWLNKDKMVYEMNEIRDHSVLGKALWDNYLFYYGNNEPEGNEASDEAPDNATSTTAAPADANPQPNSQQAASGKKQPMNPFKSRGPLSGVAVDLIGQPNQKIKLSGILFTINGFNNGAPVEDCAYVRPVEEKNQQKYMAGNTNKLLFGKAKGYGYCQIFFDNQNDADAFLNKVNWPNLTKMQVGVTKAKANSNGYFKVGTEFGPAYISAAKLNEDLTEDVEEPKKITNRDK